VIGAALVQHAQLLPDRGGQRWPAELLVTPSRNDGGEERLCLDLHVCFIGVPPDVCFAAPSDLQVRR
jgi:hypothetical protein